jgi:hypothetical protein
MGSLGANQRSASRRPITWTSRPIWRFFNHASYASQAGATRPSALPPFRMDFPARFLVLIVVVIAVTAMVQSGSGVVAACGVVVAAALTAEAICDRLEAREGPRS